MSGVYSSVPAQDSGAGPPAVMTPGAPYDSSLSQHTPPHQHLQPPLSLNQTPQGQASQSQLGLQQQFQQQQQQRSVKRPRPVKSCTECRKRKLRCDRLCPCSQCQKSNRLCKYTAENDPANLSDVSDTEMAEPARPVKRNCLPESSGSMGVPSGESAYAPTKNGDAGLPRLEDLSVRMERLEKQVLSRSPARTDDSGARIITASPDTIRGLSVKHGALRTRFFGQNNSRVLLNLFDDAKDFMSDHQKVIGSREVFNTFRNLHKVLQDKYQKLLSPISVFVDSMMPVQKRMADILPSKQACDRLYQAYLDTSETIYRMIHMPTFRQQYNLFWEGNLQSESFLPQLISILAIASRFDTKTKGLGRERVEGIHIPTACALVRSWLDSLRGKQLVELTTLETEILLLHAQRMITPRAQDTWTQLGSIVRLAMTMGLHRDPAEFEPRVTVFLGEIRRRLWFTILDMDLHISLSCSLPCLVREGDFTCKPPSNLDDLELYPDMAELPPSKPIDQLTDNQMQVYASLTLGIRMKVAHLVNRVDAIHDYQEILDVGLKLDRFLEDINYIFPRHGILSDAQRSRQWRSRVVLDMHVRRPLLALYRPFAIGAPDAPPQISRAYLRSSMVILKYLDELDPMMAHYQDISDMYHLILKRDIVQAALSVCYYIRSAIRPTHTHRGISLNQQALRMSPDSLDEYHPVFTPDNPMLWSPARLIGTVEKTLGLLVQNLSSSDTKDVVVLAVVFETVRVSDPKGDEILHGLRAVLEGCLRGSNYTPDQLAAPARPPPQPPVEQFVSDPYMRGTMPGLYPGNMGMPNDYEGWIIWDGWE